MNKFNVKYGIILGSTLIVIAILIGIIFQHDIGFVFAGIGVVIIGISILTYINRGNKKLTSEDTNYPHEDNEQSNEQDNNQNNE